MNILLWVLQGLAAVLYSASGVMKVFLFDKVSQDVPSFGALPRSVWKMLGVVELLCVIGLIIPAALPHLMLLTVIAAIVLASESLVFVGVHWKYREGGAIVFCLLLGLLMSFIVYGRSRW